MIPFRSLFSRWAVLMAREPFDWPDTSGRGRGEEGVKQCRRAQCCQALMEVNILNIYVRVKAAVARKVFKSSPSEHVTVSAALWLRVMCQHIEFLLRNEAFIAPH